MNLSYIQADLKRVGHNIRIRDEKDPTISICNCTAIMVANPLSQDNYEQKSQVSYRI